MARYRVEYLDPEDNLASAEHRHFQHDDEAIDAVGWFGRREPAVAALHDLLRLHWTEAVRLSAGPRIYRDEVNPRLLPIQNRDDLLFLGAALGSDSVSRNDGVNHRSGVIAICK